MSKQVSIQWTLNKKNQHTELSNYIVTNVILKSNTGGLQQYFQDNNDMLGYISDVLESDDNFYGDVSNCLMFQYKNLQQD